MLICAALLVQVEGLDHTTILPCLRHGPIGLHKLAFISPLNLPLDKKVHNLTQNHALAHPVHNPKQNLSCHCLPIDKSNHQFVLPSSCHLPLCILLLHNISSYYFFPLTLGISFSQPLTFIPYLERIRLIKYAGISNLSANNSSSTILPLALK